MTPHHLQQGGLALVGACFALGLSGLASGHVDDPKERDQEKPYVGPGWTRGASDGDPGFPAEGVTLMSWLPISDFGSFSGASDCWGYTAPSGREYALIGLSAATGFVDITDPGNPEIVAVMPGASSTWHDIKVFQQFAYSVTEDSGSGVQVFDLSDIDNGNVFLSNTFLTGGTGASHNVAIDTVKGHLYRTGGADNGLRIYDLTIDPVDPPLVGSWAQRYVHDAQIVTYDSGPYAGRTIAYCCAGMNGGWVDTGLTVLDVTDPSSIPIPLGMVSYPFAAYSHQIWLSEDRNYAYLNDEADEDGSYPTTTYIFDVSNPGAPEAIGSFTNGNTAIGHNLYVRDNLIFEGNYRSGMRVFDATDPEAPIEVGYLDTYPDNDSANFNGVWSVFPFFPSGTVIASDTVRGLFVMRIEEAYAQFSFPQGLPEMLPPTGGSVLVQIDELEPGGVVPGSESLTFSSDGAPFETVPLTPLGAGLFEASFPDLVCGRNVDYYFSVESPDGPRSSPVGAPGDTYSALAADDLVIVLNDDAETDPGYTVDSFELTGGEWERGVPAGFGDRGDPTVDADGSGSAWLTENVEGNSDVDGGPTHLVTPALDMSALDAPGVSYARWFTNDDLDDVLEVHISNDGGTSWVLVEAVGADPTAPLTGAWLTHEFLVDDFVDPTADMKLRFTATDLPNNSITEAGVDSVRVFSFTCGETGIPGDVDGDGDVDIEDLLAVLGSWGPCSGCPADLTGDGEVGVPDLLEVLGNWS